MEITLKVIIHSQHRPEEIRSNVFDLLEEEFMGLDSVEVIEAKE